MSVVNEVFSMFSDNPTSTQTDRQYAEGEVNAVLASESVPWRTILGGADYSNAEAQDEDGVDWLFHNWGAVYDEDDKYIGTVKWMTFAWVVNEPQDEEWQDALFTSGEFGDFIIENEFGALLLRFEDGHLTRFDG